jgi:hypothetical protein
MGRQNQPWWALQRLMPLLPKPHEKVCAVPIAVVMPSAQQTSDIALANAEFFI